MEKKMQVLLIDDCESDNAYHEIVIKKTGVKVRLHSITDSRKALEWWQKACASKNGKKPLNPELVFLDVNMAALNGFELLDRIRKIPDPLNLKKKMKIFMLTSSLDPEEYELAMKKYDDLVAGYYFKPLTGKAFQEILDKYF